MRNFSQLVFPQQIIENSFFWLPFFSRILIKKIRSGFVRFPHRFPGSAFVENINLFFIFYVTLCNPKFMFLVFPSKLSCKHVSHLIQAFVIKFLLHFLRHLPFSTISSAYGWIYCVLYEGEASWKMSFRGLILLYRAATSSIACCSNIAVNLNT